MDCEKSQNIEDDVVPPKEPISDEKTPTSNDTAERIEIISLKETADDAPPAQKKAEKEETAENKEKPIQKKFFSKTEWFERLFGFPESVADVMKNFKVNKTSDGYVTLCSEINGREFGCGRFTLAKFEDFKDLKPRGNGTFSFIHGTGMSSSDPSLVDVLSAQNRPDFNGATFQLASNYNCLEFVSCYGSATQGVTGYVYDMTQGPYGSLAAGPAIVYRNYFVPHTVDGCEYIGQCEQEINMLSKTPIKVVHGYASIPSNDVANELSKSEFDWDNRDNYTVGFHEHVQVTLRRADRGFCESTNGRFSNQVFCAAFNMRGNVCFNDFSTKLAKKILYQQYALTILCAWQAALKYPELPGSNMLFLTHLGGGVFGNRIEWICEAILKCEDLIKESGLKIFDVCYSSHEAATYFRYLGPLVKSLGGSSIKA